MGLSEHVKTHHNWQRISFYLVSQSEVLELTERCSTLSYKILFRQWSFVGVTLVSILHQCCCLGPQSLLLGSPCSDDFIRLFSDIQIKNRANPLRSHDFDSTLAVYRGGRREAFSDRGDLREKIWKKSRRQSEAMMLTRVRNLFPCLFTGIINFYLELTASHRSTLDVSFQASSHHRFKLLSQMSTV